MPLKSLNKNWYQTLNSQKTPNASLSHLSYMLSLVNIVMMMSSNGNVFHVTGHLCGEFTGPSEFSAQRSVMRSFGVFFYLCLNKQLSKQACGWWFETLSHPLLHQCNGEEKYTIITGSHCNWYCMVYKGWTQRFIISHIFFMKHLGDWNYSHLICLYIAYKFDVTCWCEKYITV